MEGVFNFLTDTKIVRPWSAEETAAKNERLLKRRAENTLTPEALLQQQKEKKQQQQERNKDAAATAKKENKQELVPNARKVIARDLMSRELWEAVGKVLNAKVDVSLTNPENAILTWNTEEEANKYELGTTLEKEEEGFAILFSAALYTKKQ
jgi:predicted NodU family carbamoyl transferase